MKTKIAVLFILFSLAVYPKEFKVDESVEITAEKGNPASYLYIDKKEIESMSVNSEQELLSLFPCIYLSVRGANGIQADLSFRGSKGNQVEVSILGVPLNNLQTYHHNFDIPLAPEDIEYVEAESSSNANITPYSFAGKINFVPGDNRKEFNHLAYGSHDYYHIYARENGLSYLFEGSGGYAENTKYNLSNATYQFDFRGAKIFTAFNSKHFDAKDFYAPYPSYERTQTSLLIVSSGKTRFYGVRHYDIFTLDKNNPDFFRNITETYKSGIVSSMDTKFGFFSVNLEFNQMNSEVMGRHNTFFSTFKYAKVFSLFAFDFRAGLNLFSTTDRGDYLLPFFNVAKDFGKYRLSFDFSRSVRVPDFTELYYNSPVNRGNENLREEKSNNFQISLSYGKANFSLFFRDEKNLIDWVRVEDYWQAKNLGSESVYGFDLNYTYKKWKIGFEHVHRDKPSFETKYSFYYPKNKLTLVYTGRDFSLDYNYLDIDGLNRASVLNLTFWGQGFYLKILNALDEDYQTYPGIPMPGRVIVFGYRMRGPLIPD